MTLIDTPAPSVRDTARTLVSAWRDGRLLNALASGPSTVGEAYQVQDAMVALIGAPGGWKVGPLRDGDPSCCPIPAIFMHAEPAAAVVTGPGPTLVEGEIAFRFARDLPSRGRPYGVEEVAAAVASVHPAIEVVSSRYVDRAAQPALHCLADLQNCAGVAVGPACRDWHGLDFARLVGCFEVDGVPVARRGVTPDTSRTLAALAWLGGDVVITGARLGPVEVDGVPVARRGVTPDTSRTLAALAWLVGHAAERGTMIHGGDVVITGARLGPVEVTAGAVVTAGFAGLGEVSVHLL